MAFTLTQLRHFVAIAENGRMSAAAERCNMTQPSLSTSLRNLEAGLGVTLFARQPRGLQLTSDGERFLRHARHILSAAREAAEDLRTRPYQGAGTVRIAVVETMSDFIVPLLLQQADRSLPHLTVEVAEVEREEAEEKVVAGEVDLAMTFVNHLSDRKRLTYDILLRSPRHLWTSINHPLLERDSVRLVDLSDYAFVLLETDEHVPMIRQYWRAQGFTPRVAYRSKSLECIRNLVGQGLGITILSDFVYRAWSHDGGRIRRKPLADAVPSLDVGVGHKRGSTLSPSTRQVLAMIRQTGLARAFASGAQRSL